MRCSRLVSSPQRKNADQLMQLEQAQREAARKVAAERQAQGAKERAERASNSQQEK
jgi:hypothetical protein